MTILARLMKGFERRRGVLAEEDIVEEGLTPPLAETAGARRLERPEPTPSMQVPGIGGTAGTPRYKTPHGTPSTERLHNPRRGA
jgi:hypothetical protein